MAAPIILSYKKQTNKKWFAACQAAETGLNISDMQNYIPFYAKFFNVNAANGNNLNLNNHFHVQELLEKVPDTHDNICKAIVKNQETGATHETLVFLKYSPLLDPFEYAMGKYNDYNILSLPSLSDASPSPAQHPKVVNVHNVSYVDSFFNYLSSQVLHKHGLVHAVDFYGSFLGIKQKFRFNVTEELPILENAEYFSSKLGEEFQIENEAVAAYFANESRDRKARLIISDEVPTLDTVDVTMMDVDIDDALTKLDIQDAKDAVLVDIELPVAVTEEDTHSKLQVQSALSVDELPTEDLDYVMLSSSEQNTPLNLTPLDDADLSLSLNSEPEASDDDTASSNTESDLEPNDDNADEDFMPQDEENEDEYEDIEEEQEQEDDDSEDNEDNEIFATIAAFPVQMIALEHCDGTLEQLLLDQETISDEGLGCMVMQVLMTLITYQHMFGLTHNDLHTSNIMYVKTDVPFLYYKVNHVYYRVPTYGYIFKIIDFGRAIYKFRGQIMCSESFDKTGDAYGQYNTEPFYKPTKPRIDPNPSFDLCRLACSMLDLFMDDISDLPNITSPIQKIIVNWCNDDKGRNVLYKRDGEERYPDFKLYKMIARTVHGHVPREVLTNPYFDRYIIKKQEAQAPLLDIDGLPNYQEK